MYVKDDRYVMVSNDEVAVARLRELEKKYRDGTAGRYDDLGEIIGISRTVISRAARYPETCTLRTYKRLAEYFNWEGYVPGRKMSVATKQGVIPFEEFTTPTDSRSEYDLREMTDSSTIEGLKVISQTLGKPFSDIVERALKLYIHDCQRVLDYARSEA